MKSALAIIGLVVVILVSAFFSYRQLYPSSPSDSKRPGVVRTVAEGRKIAISGMDYLIHLRQQGRLPGAAANEHGDATIDWRLGAYPYMLKAKFKKRDESSVNSYTIVQLNENSPWKLTRAWQADANGQVIQEWPVK